MGHALQTKGSCSALAAKDGGYHEPLRQLDHWATELTDAERVWRGALQPNQPELNHLAQPRQELWCQQARSVFSQHLSLGIADFVRVHGGEAFEQLLKIGNEILVQGVAGDTPAVKRGRLIDPQSGAPLRDGRVAQLDPELVEALAQEHFLTKARFAQRGSLVLPKEMQAQLALNSSDQMWDSASEQTRNGPRQKVYECAVALARLAQEHPEQFSCFRQSCLRLAGSGLRSYAGSFDGVYQEHFALQQAEVAWGWRNLLEPGGKLKPRPELCERDVIFRNQMAVGMLEYLRAYGTEVLDYLRDFGRTVLGSPVPFRRTEISEEHLTRPLLGVPLQNGSAINMSQGVLDLLACDHHTLWMFAREMSWLLPQKDLHQPPRDVHKPWEELSIASQNRDRLNVFGIAVLLASMPERTFEVLRKAAPAGNTYELPLQLDLSI